MSNEAKEAVELTFDKMEQYFEAAKGVIDQYGGDVAELGLMALRVDALSVILPSLIVTVLSGVIGIKTYRIMMAGAAKNAKTALRTACAKGYSSRNPFEDHLMVKYFGSSSNISKGERTEEDLNKLDLTFEWTLYTVPMSLVAGISCLVGLINLIDMINIWAWAGIFYPELYAVHKFIL